MSSILRALKKLDEESQSRENSDGVQEHEPTNTPNDIKRVVNRRTRDRQPWFKKSYFIVFPVIFLMGAAAVLLFDWNGGSAPDKRTAPITDKQSGSLPAQKKLPPLKQTQAQLQSPAQPVKLEKKEPVAPVETPPEHSTNTQTAQSSPDPAPTLPQLTDQSIKPTPNPKPTIKPAIKSATKPTIKSTELKPTTLKKTIPTKPNPQKVDRPNLTLDGILWSQKPERRVAVIDGNYYKVGETVKGVTIFEIKKKQVILQSGRDKWSIFLKH